MAKYRSFSFEFKRQVVLDFLEGRAELRGLARQHNLSRPKRSLQNVSAIYEMEH